MILKKIKDYLDGHHAKYVVISHSQAFTAQEVAASAHVPGREMAKTVMVKVDGKMMMAVVPATDYVHLPTLSKALGAHEVEIARESEFRDLFPQCETGAMPPFGKLFDVEMVVSKKLAEDPEIAFNAGSHREIVKMPYRDYERLLSPRVIEF